MNSVILIILIITASLFSLTSGRVIVNNVLTSIQSQTGNHNGVATGRINELCNVSIKFNITFLDETDNSLRLYVNFPYYVSTSYIEKCGRKNELNETIHCTPVVKFKKYIVVSANGMPQSVTPVEMYHSHNHSLFFMLNNLNLSYNNTEIAFKFRIQILPYAVNVGEFHHFGVIVMDSSANLTLRILGPKLVVSSTLRDIIADAGARINSTFKIELSPLSTENATNIRIRMVSAVGLSSSVLVGTKMRNLPITFSNPSLKTGGCIHIYTEFQITDKAHIGHPLSFHFDITYESMDYTHPKYNSVQSVSVGKMRDIKDLVISMEDPSHLFPGAIVPVSITFRIPKGVLPTLSVQLQCESTDFPSVPGTLYFSHIILGSQLTASGSSLNYSSEEGKRRGLRRKRRSAPSVITISRPSVTIAHPFSSPLTYDQVTTKAHVEMSGIGVEQLSDLPLRGTIHMKIALVYGRLHRVIRSVTTSVISSPIQVNKTYTYLNANAKGYPVFSVVITVHNQVTPGMDFVLGEVNDNIIGLSPTARTVSATPDSNATLGITTSSVTKARFYLSSGGSLNFIYTAEAISPSYFNMRHNFRVVTVNFAINDTNIMYNAIGTGCVYRENGVTYQSVPLYGYIILLLFIGLFVGWLVLLLVGILYVKVVNKDVNPFEYDDVTDPEDRLAMLETQDRLLLDEALISGDYSTVKNLSNVNPSDSIITTLVCKSRQQMYRNLDSLDILHSIYVDQNLEDEYEKLSINGVVLLMQNLTHHGTLKSDVVNKATQRFNKNVQTLSKEVQTMHKKEANKVMKELSKRNKRELQQLLSKQKKERETLEDDLDEEPEQVQKIMQDIQNRQHKVEKDDLIHKLKLQQDEESEKLRKKYSLQKRSMLREMERGFIDEIVQENPLDPAQADWLLNEHRRIQSHLDQRYDSELARQRMLLEEKLERRRALAKKKELEEENQTEMLNTLASQQVNIIRMLRRHDEISPEQSEEYLAKIKEDMLRSKEALDREKEVQEKALLAKLNDRKKVQLQVHDANHQVQETQLMSDLKNSFGSTLMDPTMYINAVMDLHVSQKNEIEQTEINFDESDTKDLINQYQYLVAQTEADVRLSKDKLLQQLKYDGVPDDELNQICERHNRELRQLQESHEEERLVQEQNFKAKLLAKRKEMESNLEQERQEQDTLRRHENAMVQNLLLNQVSISDEERDRILQEHERNMVQVENSLTLSKLRQKRMMEEAMAERKAKQMERLKQKQAKETTNKLKFAGESDDEDEQTHKDLVDMMKRHGEQKLELLQGEDLDMDDELEQVRHRMLEERASALKEQEERIAAMLSSLQLEKAKELSRIEEQQKAINNLKMNLMDDLNERGVLSDTKCQQIINRHQQEQEHLVKRLDMQRDDQERMLRERLQKRMELKEKQMSSAQKKELEEKFDKAPVKQRAQNQIRKAILLHKQMVEVEQFKTRMLKECNQTLEESRRQFNVKKEQYLQEQELNFIAGLVELGKFPKNELLEVLKILFPLKKKSELEAILNKIHSGKEEKPKPNQSSSSLQEQSDLLAQSTLVDRTKVSFQGIGSIARFKLNSPKKRQTKGNLMTLTSGNDPGGLTPIDRPDLMGQDLSSGMPDAPGGRGIELPPLESKKKKKKKKKKRSNLIDEDGDAEYDDFITVRA